MKLFDIFKNKDKKLPQRFDTLFHKLARA